MCKSPNVTKEWATVIERVAYIHKYIKDYAKIEIPLNTKERRNRHLFVQMDVKLVSEIETGYNIPNNSDKTTVWTSILFGGEH